MSKKATEAVKVMVRVRPLNKSELAMGGKSVVKVNPKDLTVEISNPNETNGIAKKFTYDAVYDVDS